MTNIAFVAGATGYTGREIVRLLADAARESDDDVLRPVAHIRPDSSRITQWTERFAAMGAELDTSPWELEALAATFRRLQPRVVFCAIGTIKARGRAAKRRGGAEESYETIDFGLTKLLADALVASGVEVERFIYISAAGVSPRAAGAYGRWRWKAEEAVRASGLPYTIARPSFIVGPDRDDARPGERYGAAAMDGALGLVGAIGLTSFRDRYRSNTNVALARALIRHGLDASSRNREVESEGLREP